MNPDALPANRDAVPKKVLDSFSRVLAEMPEDCRTPLALRYGLDGNGRHGFSRIAKRLSTSKAQIQRLCERAVRVLRKPCLWRLLEKHLAWADDLLWSSLSRKASDSGSFVPKNAIASLESKLGQFPGESELLISLFYDTPNDWIRQTSHENERNRFRARYLLEVLQNAMDVLSEEAAACSDVMLADTVLEKLGGDSRLLETASRIHDLDFAFVSRFLAVKPISSVALRAIRIYLILYHRYHCSPVKMERLTDDFNGMYMDDKINADIVRKTIERHPGLLGLLGGSVWATGYYSSSEAGANPENTEHAENAPAGVPPEQYFERPWGETPVKDFAIEILEFKGIATIAEAGREFVKRTAGRYHKANVQMTFRLVDSIVEVAPSYYGIWEDRTRSFPGEKYMDLLLKSRPCARYVVHAHAGEPLSAYPMWSREMEYRWCRWAEAESQIDTKAGPDGTSGIYRKRQVFESLLNIATPEEWPVSEEEKTVWIFKKQCLGRDRFLLDFKKREWWQKKVALQDLFAVTVLARRLGYMNWIRASSEMIMTRPSAQAAPVLMLMVLLDILRPADHWQRRHELGDYIDEAVDSMVAEIKRKGFVHWRDEVGAKLLGRIKANTEREGLGWVSGKDAEAVLGVIGGKRQKTPVEENPAEKTSLPSIGTKEIKPKQEQLELPF